MAEEAKVRKLVSETPLADREYQEAHGDLERHRKYHSELQRQIDELIVERDKLLEELARGG